MQSGWQNKQNVSRPKASYRHLKKLKFKLLKQVSGRDDLKENAKRGTWREDQSVAQIIGLQRKRNRKNELKVVVTCWSWHIKDESLKGSWK